MTPSFRSGLLAGFLSGAALTTLAFLLVRPRPSPLEPEARSISRAPESRPQQPQPVPPAVEPEPTKGVAATAGRKADPPADDPRADVPGLFASLSEAGLAGFGSPKFSETLQAVKASGKPALDYLANVLRTATSALPLL